MRDLAEVVKISYVREYVYHVVFDDGLSGELDFVEYLDRGPMFLPLRAPEFFRAATVRGGTIAWPNGLDLAPESLHRKLAASPSNLNVE